MVVGVSPASALHARPRLFAALAAALDVGFAPLGEVPVANAILEVGAHDASGDNAHVGHGAAPVAAFADAYGERSITREVRLTRADALDARLRGLTLNAQQPEAGLGPVTRAETVLAEDREGFLLDGRARRAHAADRR